MLDEEVRFRQVLAIPKSKTLSATVNIGETGLVLGSAVAGYLGAKHGLDFTTFWSVLIGGGTGLGIGISIGNTISSAIEEQIKNKFRRKTAKLEEQAKADGATVARFEYRGNELECVLLPEYAERGHIFEMSTNDVVIGDPLFSYQPQREKSLSFRFETPMLDVEREAMGETSRQPYDKLFNMRLGALTREEDSEKAVKDYVGRLKTDLNNYLAALKSVLQEFNGRLSQGEKVTLDTVRTKGGIKVTFSYEGERYDERLTAFTNSASQLMNTTFKHRSKVSI